MQTFNSKVGAPITMRPRAWSRNRVQIGGAMLFAGLVPAVATSFMPESFPALLQTTTIGILLAIGIGFYLLKNLTVFPGMRASYYVMPAFLVSYGLVVTSFFFFRLDYSRGLFLVSFLLCLFWTYLAYFFATRDAQMPIGVVPFGNVRELPEASTVTWVPLLKPIAANRYDALVADFAADLPNAWEAFLAESAIAGVPVFHIKQLREALTGRVEIEHLSENSFGSLIPFMGYLRFRRIIDFVAALVAGLILLPFLLVVALLLRLDSPGPVLYRQRRIGYRGEPFLIAKFRTMRADSGADGSDRSSAMTSDNDPRITRFGRFLRRSRIDELPQLINILKGEMSWIGPRPEAEALSRWYESDLPFYRYRHIVPPGISGWAQVNQGHVAEIEDVTFKLHYDFYYIKNFSPWLDILIVIRTVQTILTGFGSR